MTILQLTKFLNSDAGVLMVTMGILLWLDSRVLLVNAMAM